jgi:hypothetical protein
MSIWNGTPPAQCEVCSCSLIRCGEFIDGKTKMGPWAVMCPGCHKSYGQGLGTGKGQKYARREKMTPDGAPEVVWEKVNP